MAKTEIGETYGLGYGDEPETFPAAQQLAFVDEGEDYSVDRTVIYRDGDGTFILATASGCSCWDGEWYAVRYDTIEELWADIGPEGEADYEYMPGFGTQTNLRKQVEEALRQ